ncbi:MAG: type I glyceraldehyde-3-phosphate dehydrogenase [Candidatus Babeliales bacterium]
MKKRIAINGFGRIGRTFLRIALTDKTCLDHLEIVAINIGPSDASNMAHLFMHDSIMGTFDGTVTLTDSTLTINGINVTLLTVQDPEHIDWKSLNIDWVVEASGHFTSRQGASKHLNAGAKKVVITAPASDEDITIIPGVNNDAYDRTKHSIVSLGSCTTNCFAPLVKILHESFVITEGLMSTVHAYTNDQVLLDVEHKDPRRARAAGFNIIPTKTGADSVITKIYPALIGKLKASSLRVPVPVVSIIDFTFSAEKPFTKESINTTLKAYAHNQLKGIVQYEEEPLVSSDFIGNQHSCIVDALLTQSVGHMGKVFAWYDNEFGYSCRIKDFLLHIS